MPCNATACRPRSWRTCLAHPPLAGWSLMGSKGYNDPLITVGGAGVMHATVARHAPSCCHCSRCYAHTSTGAPLRSSCCHPPFSGREAQCNAAHSAARAATRHTLPLPSPSLFPAKPPTPSPSLPLRAGREAQRHPAGLLRPSARAAGQCGPLVVAGRLCSACWPGCLTSGVLVSSPLRGSTLSP